MVLRCTMSLTTEPPGGSNIVPQPPDGGSQYGPVRCPKLGFGSGIAGDSFKVPDSGDSVGRYIQYFHAGSITGRFDLVPQEGGQVSANFEAQSWIGKITILGGTGVYKGISAKNGTGVLKCASPDTVHLKCTEKIRLTAL